MDYVKELLLAGYDPYELYGAIGCVEGINDFICEEEEEEEEGDE